MSKTGLSPDLTIITRIDRDKGEITVGGSMLFGIEPSSPGAWNVGAWVKPTEEATSIACPCPFCSPK